MRRCRRNQRGFVMLIVLLILLVLLVAGAYELQARESDIRSMGKFRMSELLTRAAEAGAAHRLAEIAITREPIAILDEGSSTASSSWNTWPPAGLFTSATDVGGMIQYRTAPVQFVWKGNVPPPGVSVGTDTYLFEVTSFAAPNTLVSGEASVAVGFKTWDVLPSSYGP